MILWVPHGAVIQDSGLVVSVGGGGDVKGSLKLSLDGEPFLCYVT